MVLLTPITSPQAGVRAFDIAVLPVGSFEQHGSHLPLVTDTVIACIIGQAISDAYSLFHGLDCEVIWAARVGLFSNSMGLVQPRAEWRRRR
jgi:creatinine amidohydrolase/Fe(II)-dependent formamide hydrolase-like protein